MLTLASNLPEEAELGDLAFRVRLRAYALAITVSALGLYLFESIGDALMHRELPWWSHWLDPGDMAALALITASAGAAYWLGAGRTWKPPKRIADICCALVPSGLATLAGVLDPDPVRMSTATLLFVSALILVRAAIIPSSPQRTGSYGLAASALAFVGMLWMEARDPELTAAHLVTRALRTALVFACVVGTAAMVSHFMAKLVRAAHRSLQLGHYELGERIGAGGMGEIYRATHVLMKRTTAIKLLPRNRQNETERLRFEREAQLTSQLTHPNTVAIYDYGRSGEGRLYLVMELIRGWDLTQIVDRGGPIEAPRVIHVLCQICGSLGEAHQLGLVHRDIKPSNVMLCERAGEPDIVKVVDFGLARSLDGGAPALTSASTFVGTPHYAAPEIIRGERAGPAADIYAVGALGYFLLTGRPPFEGNTVIEVCAQHLSELPEKPSSFQPDVPPDLEALLLLCLEKRATARPASAGALRAELERCADSGGWSRAEAQAWWLAHRAVSLPTEKKSAAATGTVVSFAHREARPRTG